MATCSFNINIDTVLGACDQFFRLLVGFILFYNDYTKILDRCIREIEVSQSIRFHILLFLGTQFRHNNHWIVKQHTLCGKIYCCHFVRNDRRLASKKHYSIANCNKKVVYFMLYGDLSNQTQKSVNL